MWRERSRLETEEEEGDGADEEPRVPFSAEYSPCHLTQSQSCCCISVPPFVKQRLGAASSASVWGWRGKMTEFLLEQDLAPAQTGVYEGWW